jgi:hypothetical protein
MVMVQSEAASEQSLCTCSERPAAAAWRLAFFEEKGSRVLIHVVYMLSQWHTKHDSNPPYDLLMPPSTISLACFMQNRTCRIVYRATD